MAAVVSIELVNESITRIDVARAGSPTTNSTPLVSPSSEIKEYVVFSLEEKI